MKKTKEGLDSEHLGIGHCKMRLESKPSHIFDFLKISRPWKISSNAFTIELKHHRISFVAMSR